MADDKSEKTEKSNSKKAKKTKKLSNKKKILVVGGLVIGLLVVGAIGLSVYSFTQLQSVKKNPQKIITDETKSYVEKVSKHIDVPMDEEPQVARVQDEAKAKENPFFKNVKNGDVVLVFAKAQKAVIYRPSEDKLINVGPLNIERTKVGVAVLGAGGDVQAAQKAITDKLGNSVVISFSGDAKSKTEVSKTTVVDVSGQQAELAKQVAAAVGGEVAGKLPNGEAVPVNTSIVVIYK